MITTEDIQALIAYAILNNKPGVILAMNNAGYTVPDSIKDVDLFFALWTLYRMKGLPGLKTVLDNVEIKKEKVSAKEATAFAVKFKGINPNAKFGDILNQIGTFFGDLIGGSTTVTQGGTTVSQQTSSVLPTWVVPTVSIVGILVIAYMFIKNIPNAVSFSIVIGVLIIGVMLYGGLAKQTVISQQGGGGTSTTHGGILTSFSNWLNNVSLSIVGG